MRFLLFLLLSFVFISSRAQHSIDSLVTESDTVLHTATGDIYGTLCIPKASGTKTVALLIAGSGPTDRNGNNAMMKNGSLQKLAYALASNNIASLRFDKRGIGESRAAAKKEADLRFEDYVNDASGWIDMLKKDNRFAKVIVIGHSEGSLIGMIAGSNKADGFVSIAGAGRSADKILKEQLSSQPEQVKEMCFPIIDSLVAGKTVSNVNPALFSLFRPSVQPYMISWFHYDPQTEIKKLKIPALIVQGTNDLQVSIDDAKLLAKANPHAQLVLINGMNHIMKIVPENRAENIASYNNDSLPVSEELINGIVKFIKKL
jgi:uncharacterized protein